MAASSASEPVTQVRTWLFHPDGFELWGKLEQDGAGQLREESTRYVVNDHVGLPAALLDGAGELEWTDDGWNKRHGCFVAGTLVATPKGLAPIEQIRVGDRVLTALDFARGHATLPPKRAGEASFQDVAAAQALAASSGALIDLPPASQSGAALEEAGDDVPGPNGKPFGGCTGMDEVSGPLQNAHSAGAGEDRTGSASKPWRFDPRPPTGLVAAALLSAAAAAPASAPDVPIERLEVGSWHVLEVTLVPDEDEDHPYAIELLRPSSWLSERGIKGPGDRVRLALDELDVEGWATLCAVSPASAPPDQARNVVSMVLNHESTDVWEIKLKEASDEIRLTGVHPLKSLEGEQWLRAKNAVRQERPQIAEGAVAIEALHRIRPENVDSRFSSMDGRVFALQAWGEKNLTRRQGWGK